MPKIFDQHDKRGNQRVLRLKKSLYGIRNIPIYFWKYLTHKLISGQMLHSNLDPLLFIGDKFICIVYVDCLIFWAKDESDIHDLEMIIFDLGVDLEQEDDSTVFLGVNLERNEETGKLNMKQPVLIDRVISDVVIDKDMAKGKYTPAGYLSSVKNEDDVPDSGIFKYRRVVGIFPYLSGHTSPDISSAFMYGH